MTGNPSSASRPLGRQILQWCEQQKRGASAGKPRLDQVQEILAEHVQRGADKSEADQPAAEAESLRVVANYADTVADACARAGSYDIGQGKADVDEKAEEEKRRGPA